MKKILLASLFFAVVSTVSFAQTAEDAIARATMAAPPALQANAMVIELAADGTETVLREGTNGLVCWDRSDEPNRSFSAQCTSLENMSRIKQNRVWSMSGKTPEEIRALRDAAEADGSREVSAFGSIYYTLSGEDAESASMHITLAVPFATAETLGLPDQGSYTQAGAWIMEAGMSAAHIMLPGR